MKKILLPLFLLGGFLAQAQPGNRLGNAIIFDTNVGPDCDDIAALGMLHALADKGEIRPLGVISSNGNESATEIVSIVNNYFGREELPVATAAKNAPAQKDARDWSELLQKKYPAERKDRPAAVETYRRLLAAQPDQSVIIVSTGLFTNLAQLLESKADKISPLDGTFLVRRKVRRLISLVGEMPAGGGYNIESDSLSAAKVFAEWPTEIVFTGSEIGKDIRTGQKLVANESVTGPVKDIYQLAASGSESGLANTSSPDQTTMLVAARGIQPYFGLRRGRFSVENNRSFWTDDPMGAHAYITAAMPAEALASIIEGLMMWNRKK